LFNKYKTNLPAKYHYLFAKAWVGMSGMKRELKIQIMQDLQEEAYNKAVELFKTNPYHANAIDPSLPVEDDEVQRKVNTVAKSNYYQFSVVNNIGSDDDGDTGNKNWHNRFFLQLKAKAPEKYYKAVKEFIKLI
jgi:hypothetical protein